MRRAMFFTGFSEGRRLFARGYASDVSATGNSPVQRTGFRGNTKASPVRAKGFAHVESPPLTPFQGCNEVGTFSRCGAPGYYLTRLQRFLKPISESEFGAAFADRMSGSTCAAKEVAREKRRNSVFRAGDMSPQLKRRRAAAV